jgi:hypothetical protein
MRDESTTNQRGIANTERNYPLDKANLSVSKTHLHRYCDEFSFRWDERKVTNGQRTVEAIKGAEGKRLIYQQAAQAS